MNGSVGTTDAAAQVERDGWAVLPNVVPPELVATLRANVADTMTEADTRFGGNAFLGEHTRRVFNLLSHGRSFWQVPIFEPVLAVAEHVLDDQLLLSSLTAVTSHPGQTPQPLHCDDGSIPLPRPRPPLAVAAIWALTDFDEVNGGTRLVPGSHRFDRRPRPDDDPETVHVEMSAGSVLVYNTSLWHGGGANQSADSRVFIVCNWCAGFIRQEESQLLAVDRDVVAGFPPRLRELMGYGVYRGLHGHVAGTDPGSWFDESVASDLVWNRMR